MQFLFHNMTLFKIRALDELNISLPQSLRSFLMAVFAKLRKAF